MRIAINGTGIAGPTLAYWLQASAYDVLLIEASRRRLCHQLLGRGLRHRREDGPAALDSRAGLPGQGGALRRPAWP